MFGRSNLFLFTLDHGVDGDGGGGGAGAGQKMLASFKDDAPVFDANVERRRTRYPSNKGTDVAAAAASAVFIAARGVV